MRFIRMDGKQVTITDETSFKNLLVSQVIPVYAKDNNKDGRRLLADSKSST